MRILVIDDDVEVQELLNKILTWLGHEVLTADNGKVGIQKLKNNQPVDLVIIDIIMPEKEGFETIRELKRDFPETKIIAISGGGRIDAQNYLKMAKIFGADDTVSKSFLVDELTEAIGKLFKK